MSPSLSAQPERSTDDGPPRSERRRPVRLVALVASAGGLRALSEVLGSLPSSFPAPVLVVEHLQAARPSLLAAILDRRSPLRVQEAAEGDPLEAGTAYVAPPDAHLVVRSGAVALDRRPPIGYLRPRGDLLLESLVPYRSEAAAVVLSGTGNDGSAGARALHAAGGLVLVEDPETAEFAGMPAAALATGTVDAVLPLEQVAAALVAAAACGAAR